LFSIHYVPRGYLSVRRALHRLIEKRHPSVTSHLELCEAEITKLEQLKSRSRRRRVPSNGIGGHSGPDSAQPTFTIENERQLAELASKRNELLDLCNSVANELRVALAEGDLAAKLLIDDGHEHTIEKSRWRASDGMNCVRENRISLTSQTDPFDILELNSKKGVAFLMEAQFDGWIDAKPSTIRYDGQEFTQTPRQPPSKVALRTWYWARVQSRPADQQYPSELRDWEDAKKAFSEFHVTRDSIRVLRAELAPAAWTAPGRRKLTRE
jgi:hypothetical protein